MNHGTVPGHSDSCLSVVLHFEKQNRTLNSSGNEHLRDVIDISASNRMLGIKQPFTTSAFKKRKESLSRTARYPWFYSRYVNLFVARISQFTTPCVASSPVLEQRSIEQSKVECNVMFIMCVTIPTFRSVKYKMQNTQAWASNIRGCWLFVVCSPWNTVHYFILFFRLTSHYISLPISLHIAPSYLSFVVSVQSTILLNAAFIASYISSLFFSTFIFR